MNKVIKKLIKKDKSKLGAQVIINVKEDDICIAINSPPSDVTHLNLTYNQLCSLSQAIHAAIDNHYQSYSNCMTKEKTQKIYIDDPIDW